MLFCQIDELLIGPLILRIMEGFQINKVQMGPLFVALIIGTMFYAIWGFRMIDLQGLC